MARQDVINAINQYIYPNNDNEVTATMVREPLYAIVSFIGDAGTYGIGTVSQGSNGLVTGDAVYQALQGIAPVYTAGTGIDITGTVISVAASTMLDIADGKTAYGWGNHANAGYLTGITSTMVNNAYGFTISGSAGQTYNLGTISSNAANGNTAYGWGNHALAGYLTGITSTMISNALGYTPANGANYLPLTGGTLTGPLTIKPNDALGVQDGLLLWDVGTGGGEALKIRWKSTDYDTGISLYPNVLSTNLTISGNGIWHAGNSNKSDVAWKASSLSVYDRINFATGGTMPSDFPSTIFASSSLFLIVANQNLPIQIGWRNVSTPAIYATTSGDVGIGTDYPSYKLDVNGTFHAANSAVFDSTIRTYGNVGINTAPSAYALDVGGSIHLTGDLSMVSDKTKKTYIKDAVLTLDEMADAPAVVFAWKDSGKISAGTYSQYWKKIIPELVNDDLSMAYANLGLVGLINLARKVRELEKKIDRI